MQNLTTIFDKNGIAYPVVVKVLENGDVTLCLSGEPIIPPEPGSGCCSMEQPPCWVDCTMMSLVRKYAPCAVNNDLTLIRSGFGLLWKQLAVAIQNMTLKSEGTGGYNASFIDDGVRHVLRLFQDIMGDSSGMVGIACNNQCSSPDDPCCKDKQDPAKPKCPCEPVIVEEEP